MCNGSSQKVGSNIICCDHVSDIHISVERCSARDIVSMIKYAHSIDEGRELEQRVRYRVSLFWLTAAPTYTSEFQKHHVLLRIMSLTPFKIMPISVRDSQSGRMMQKIPLDATHFLK